MFSLKGNEEYSDRVQIQWNHEAFDKIAGGNGHILSKNICKSQKKSARDIWNSVADSQKIPLEEGAWERDVAERYGKDGENT